MDESFDISNLELPASSLPQKSSLRYRAEYKEFMDWRNSNQIQSFSENVLIAYFDEMSKKYKSSSLWSKYSMIKTTLNLNHGTDIGSYVRLRSLLKKKSENYTAKKSKTLNGDEVQEFINTAPDHNYLAAKVVLIMGVMGACKKIELYNLQTEDVQDLGNVLLVTITNTQTKIPRTFTVVNNLYDICKSYMALRPPNCNIPHFFLNYQNGKCSVQRIGINKFSIMGKLIASFLKLPDANMYTGHCFRRSSSTILVDSGGHIISLKRQRKRRPDRVEENDIDSSNDSLEIEEQKEIDWISNEVDESQDFDNNFPAIKTEDEEIFSEEEEVVTEEEEVNTIDMSNLVTKVIKPNKKNSKIIIRGNVGDTSKAAAIYISNCPNATITINYTNKPQ